MTSFSSSLYGGSSTISRCLRRTPGIASRSTAVVIHRTGERSNGTPRKLSRKPARREASRTSRRAPASASRTLSTPSRTKTGLVTPDSRICQTIRPGAMTSAPRRSASSEPPPAGSSGSRDSLTCGRRSARATVRAREAFPVPGGPARHSTGSGSRTGAARTTSAVRGSTSMSLPARKLSTVKRSRACGHTARKSRMRAFGRSRPTCEAARASPARRRSNDWKRAVRYRSPHASRTRSASPESAAPWDARTEPTERERGPATTGGSPARARLSRTPATTASVASRSRRVRTASAAAR